jgi:integrase
LKRRRTTTTATATATRTSTTRYNSSNNQQELITSIPSKIAFSNFVNAINSPETREKYSYTFLKYTEYLNIERDNITSLLQKDVRVIQSDIIEYIMKMREEKYSYSTLKVMLASIFLFFDMNDIILNKKKINRYLGEHTKTNQDRAYTRQEIKRIIDACDLKYKVVVSLMASAGCRIGAIPNLRLSALRYIQEYQLYQVTFYEQSKRDAYYSFTTPECAIYINEYLKYRERSGEKLNNKSILIRDDFIIGDLLHIENPRPLALISYIMQLRNILIKTGLRKNNSSSNSSNSNSNKNKNSSSTTSTSTSISINRKGGSRKEVSANHGYRKFVHTTMANAKINIEIRELLLGHSIGLGDAYYRPTPEDCLSEYLKCIDDLTINPEHRLEKKVKSLEEKNQEAEYVIKGKLQTMAEQNQFLTSKLIEYEEAQKEGRIISKEYSKNMKEQNQRLSMLEEKFDQLTTKFNIERKLDREFESETDPELKDKKFNNMISAKRETISKRSELENKIK